MPKPAPVTGDRHCAPPRLLDAGYEIHTKQELLSHSGASTTMIYAHILNCGERRVRSPIDAIV